jgi:superfamily II DNA/RNA helicase
VSAERRTEAIVTLGSRVARVRARERFARGEIDVVVAADFAARSIQLPDRVTRRL